MWSMLELAKQRNAIHNQRLKKIEQHATNIWNIIDWADSFIDKDLVSDKAYKSILSTKQELHNLLLESKHHVKWLYWLHREVSDYEQQKILENLLIDTEPRTEDIITNTKTLFSYFNRVSKYKKVDA